MYFLTNDKLVIVGAAGMIGSNMAQTAAMMKLTPNICLYDVNPTALEGMIEEMHHCDFDGINMTYTTSIEEAFTDAKYIISSGGAPRRDGMTREDLLKGNAQVAAELGQNIRKYCPDVKHVTVIFNPADITGLVTMLHAGIEPNRVTTLAALDSTRLQSELAKYFNVSQDEVTGARTYGGHGETMAVFASQVKIAGTPLIVLVDTEKLPREDWNELRERVIQGGANIIKLRGRSSFQSPAYLSLEMIRAAMGGKKFDWPSGCYMNTEKFKHIMMAMETEILPDGTVTHKEIQGTPKEMADLDASYEHLCKLRDEIIQMGIIPPVSEWHTLNPHIDA
ncbi:malate dehydrogenase [Porphyromonadaceae bacterium W3.11]|nr:malate dehydrogenase [Porphyromonadaceae bacterium W3.11]